MTVVDASAIVAFLADGSDLGDWVAAVAWGSEWHAPDLLNYEVANVLRRYEQSGELTADQATRRFASSIASSIVLHPLSDLAPRVWELRRNLTPYDAAYVALAESLHARLITLDARLAGAPRLLCEVLSPPRSM